MRSISVYLTAMFVAACFAFTPVVWSEEGSAEEAVPTETPADTPAETPADPPAEATPTEEAPTEEAPAEKSEATAPAEGGEGDALAMPAPGTVEKESYTERALTEVALSFEANGTSREVTAEPGQMTEVKGSATFGDKHRSAVVRVKNTSKTLLVTVVWPSGRSRLLKPGQSVSNTILKREGVFQSVFLQNSHNSETAKASLTYTFR